MLKCLIYLKPQEEKVSIYNDTCIKANKRLALSSPGARCSHGEPYSAFPLKRALTGHSAHLTPWMLHNSNTVLVSRLSFSVQTSNQGPIMTVYDRSFKSQPVLLICDSVPLVIVGSAAVESWAKAQSRPWAQTQTTYLAAGSSTPGGRKETSPSGKALSWSGWRWTAPFTWSNTMASTVCTASSSLKITGCPICRCCQRKLVSVKTSSFYQCAIFITL